MDKQLDKILIIKPSSLGDIIHGLIVAQSIRAQLPGIKIDWVVRREFAAVIEAAALVDHYYIFERDGAARGFLRLAREIRQTKYDAVLDMQGLARSGILTAAAKAPRKLGRFDAREGASLAYNESTSAPAGGGPFHAVEILSGFLPLLGLENQLSESIEFKAPKVPLEPIQEPTRGARILIFPESRRSEKNWNGYEALTKQLLQQESVEQVIWCGHNSVQPEEAFNTEGFINLTAKTTIDQLPALMSSANCILSNDSGPMHLAASLARPIVALFGPTDPKRFGPFPSVPQRQHIIRRADGNMSSITTEEVEKAVIEVLNATTQ